MFHVKDDVYETKFNATEITLIVVYREISLFTLFLFAPIIGCYYINVSGAYFR